MHQPEPEQWRERIWRRPLTAEQLAELRAAQPDATDVQLEASLSEALTRLPDAAVPSNFTARVLQDIQREAPSARPDGRNWTWVWRVWFPRAGVAALVIGLGWFFFRQHQAQETARIADSLKAVASVRSLPSPQVLEDFEVIQKLDSNPAADPELIALLQ